MTNFGQALKKLRKNANLTIDELAKKLNTIYGTKLSKSSISRWENSDADPKLEFVRILTDFFGVESSVFFDGDIKKNDDILSKINKTSSQLQPPRQENVLNYAEEQLKIQNKKENNITSIEDYKIKYNNNNKIPFTRIGATGAGIGEELCDDVIKETVYFDKNEVDEELIEMADFCVYVNGDSMEPAIKRDSYAFVRRINEIRNGLVALIIYDGTALIKKLDINDDSIDLISLNPKYETIKVEPHHQFKLIGKIVQ